MNLTDLTGPATTLPSSPPNSVAQFGAAVALPSGGISALPSWPPPAIVLSGATGPYADATGVYAYAGEDGIVGNRYYEYGQWRIAKLYTGEAAQYALYAAEAFAPDADLEVLNLGPDGLGPVTDGTADSSSVAVSPPWAFEVSAEGPLSGVQLPAATTLPPGEENILNIFPVISGGAAPEMPVAIPHTEAIAAGVNTRVHVEHRTSPVRIELPETPTEGQWVEIIDASLQADTYDIEVDANGNEIEGSSYNYIINERGAVLELVFRASPGNWKIL